MTASQRLPPFGPTCSTAALPQFIAIGGINTHVVHRWRKVVQGGHEDGRAHRVASDDSSNDGAARQIEVGGYRFARRTAPRRDHDVHHLAEQRYRRTRSLDPRSPRVSRLLWRRVPMDTQTI